VAPNAWEIVSGRRAIMPETALRIATALGTEARLWLAMQQAHELHEVETERGARLRAEVHSAA
jgi:addiction module HigA family antidote